MKHRRITAIEQVVRYLERRAIELAAAENLESVANFPFKSALMGLDKMIQLLPDAVIFPAITEELLVQSFVQVFLRRPLHYAPLLRKLLHKRRRHFLLRSDQWGDFFVELFEFQLHLGFFECGK